MSLVTFLFWSYNLHQPTQDIIIMISITIDIRKNENRIIILTFKWKDWSTIPNKPNMDAVRSLVVVTVTGKLKFPKESNTTYNLNKQLPIKSRRSVDMTPRTLRYKLDIRDLTDWQISYWGSHLKMSSRVHWASWQLISFVRSDLNKIKMRSIWIEILIPQSIGNWVWESK